MFSQELQITFSLAVGEAKRRRHEYVTVEHFLYAFIHDETGIEIIESCGGDIEELRKSLEDFFEKHLELLPEGEDQVPEQTIGLQRVVQKTVIHMHSSGKDEIELGDMLASLMEEKNSHAVSYLEALGISRLDVLNCISHDIVNPVIEKPGKSVV